MPNPQGRPVHAARYARACRLGRGRETLIGAAPLCPDRGATRGIDGPSVCEDDLVRHWTLSKTDLEIITRRRRPHNRLGFAIQLCALRYPGRLLRPGELIAASSLDFVADQIEVAAEALAEYAARGPTRYEQLGAVRDVFGFQSLSRPLRAALQEWLLPVALTTTSGAHLARILLDEFRRRQIIVPGISLIERMSAQALLLAERHVADLLTRQLTDHQRTMLDGLIAPDGKTLSGLALARQPSGRAGRREFAAILHRLETLRAIGLDTGAFNLVHPERLRRLHQEGGRLTAQHLRALRATHGDMPSSSLQFLNCKCR
ncbi:MAG: DUF4158 domain-containing protein [Nitrospiraceae bacterium]|nr:DUF4158 domain-containing protein [Nitrospiraceae bacterium]